MVISESPIGAWDGPGVVGEGGVVVLKCREGCSSAGSRMARLCRPEPGETMHN